MKYFDDLITRLPKIESRSLKYGYSNARVKGMKGQLLNQTTLNDLVKLSTVDSMVELLQRTEYKKELGENSLTLSGSNLIEVAASKNFARNVSKIIKLTPKNEVPVVRSLLTKWDLLNLKTIMHARKLGQTFDEVKPNLFMVGGLEEEEFKRILAASDDSLLREVRRTKLGKLIFDNGKIETAFTSALRSTKAFFENENQVDTCSYLIVDEQLAKFGGKEVLSLRTILRREIDARNILIIQRMKKRGTDKKIIMNSLIQGGSIPKDLLGRINDKTDLAGVIGMIKSKFPELSVKEGSELTMNSFEIALEKSVAIQKVRSFHRSILSIGVMTGFILLKEEEVNNLRKIAKGKEFNIPESEVREMLVLV